MHRRSELGRQLTERLRCQPVGVSRVVCIRRLAGAQLVWAAAVRSTLIVCAAIAKMLRGGLAKEGELAWQA
eukprot:5891584-Prymnesium_polylepis.1